MFNNSKTNQSKISLFIILAFFLISGNAWGLPITGTNITIYDNRGYKGSGVGGEDQETEPGMINNQYWDLEMFWESMPVSVH